MTYQEKYTIEVNTIVRFHCVMSQNYSDIAEKIEVLFILLHNIEKLYIRCVTGFENYAESVETHEEACFRSKHPIKHLTHATVLDRWTISAGLSKYLKWDDSLNNNSSEVV